ncbi:outer membrane protein [Pseudoblastomonas halimionae]|uniref:Outer membrane beta-barrel protein n=1 Tax=Alteriqipengyuania halimionae TaxID=1926630 RepID=A0A6I4U673_9SPHN|nr:outer membrane beta-barrel protein [Alteriqipengyuania halimionae]MXP09931.1 outer membrane beta-barrel protein [Alteriqipengyuania halimionae]
MKTYISLAAVAAALVATPSLAQDATETFTGPYVAATVGIDSLGADDGTDRTSEEGVVYGGVIGYDYALSGAVLGAEAELTGSSVDVGDTDVIAAGDELTLGAGRDIYVGARAGVLVGGNGLLYVKGGYTNQKLNLDYTAGATSFSESSDLDGYRLGAGGEFRLSNNLTARVEYRYSNYGDFEVAGTSTGVDLDRHQGVATIAYRF